MLRRDVAFVVRMAHTYPKVFKVPSWYWMPTGMVSLDQFELHRNKLTQKRGYYEGMGLTVDGSSYHFKVPLHEDARGHKNTTIVFEHRRHNGTTVVHEVTLPAHDEDSLFEKLESFVLSSSLS